MRAESIRLFHTLEHPCGYFRERIARNLVIDPLAEPQRQIYDQALVRGFRRAGGHIYRPHCQGCQACLASRVPCNSVQLNRSQTRCWKRNGDLELRVCKAQVCDEYLALYRHYLGTRHVGGGMDDPSEEDFSRFLLASWSDTRLLELRLHGKLLALAVTDVSPHGLSAVYTCFDPAYGKRGLGTYAILCQLELARQWRLPHLYLGFWISGHPKMDYKRHFVPLELLVNGTWQTLNSAGPRKNAG